MMQWVLIVSIKIHLDLPTCGKCSKGIFRSYRVGYFYVHRASFVRARIVSTRDQGPKNALNERGLMLMRQKINFKHGQLSGHLNLKLNT